MIAVAKLVLLTLVAIIAMAMSSEGRQLLDYYDDCYNGAYLDTYLSSELHCSVTACQEWLCSIALAHGRILSHIFRSWNIRRVGLVCNVLEYPFSHPQQLQIGHLASATEIVLSARRRELVSIVLYVKPCLRILDGQILRKTFGVCAGYRGWDWSRGDYYCHGRKLPLVNFCGMAILLWHRRC